MGQIDLTLWENRFEDPEAVEAEFRGPKGREWLLRWLPARAHDNGMFLIIRLNEHLLLYSGIVWKILSGNRHVRLQIQQQRKLNTIRQWLRAK